VFARVPYPLLSRGGAGTSIWGGYKMDKICSRCKELKDIDDFHIDRSRKDGHVYWCKSCVKEYQDSVPEKRKKWSNNHYVKNKELILERQKKFRIEHPEEYKSRQKKSYLKHREKRLAKMKERRDSNPKEYNESKRIYAFLKGRRKNPHYKGYLEGDGCCLYCGEINPFMLENHHVWGVNEDPEFTITLCANHHKPFIRLPEMMANWGEPIF